MSSDSGSDSESNASGSPARGPAPTPGHGLDRSPPESPDYSVGQQKSRSRSDTSPPESPDYAQRKSRSRSGSPAGSQKSGSAARSRASDSEGSHRSDSPDSKRSGSPASQRSGTAASNKSGSKSRSPSPANSQASNRSKSQRSRSPASNKSGSHRSRSGSAASKRSSHRSRSGSVASNKSGSHRSGSGGSRRSRSGSRRSRSGSAASNKSGSHRSRSDSHRSRSGSHRSRSGSEASKGSGSRSRSGSAASRRSRSGSPGSKRSRSGSRRSRSGSRHSRSGSRKSRSGSPGSRRSRSRSGSKDRSGSNSPNLQIDEGDEQPDKRKRDSSEEGHTKRLKALISDSEDEGGEMEKVDAADIFGDADDISSEEERDKAGSDKEDGRRSRSEDGKQSEEEADQVPVIEEEEDKENEPEPIPETRIDVEVPKITCDLGRDIHFVKLPNFLSVETRPYDPETYEDEIDEEETLDEEGRARLKLKVENTIRWREIMDDDGNMKKESNARIVKWSDGSYSLHLGAEIFDVYKQPLQGDHNHLFIRQGTGLQGQAVFRTKLSFRPHSTESFTHRKMTLSLADRSTKTTGIKIMSQVGVDPDLDKAVRLKKEEEKLRQHPAKQKTTRKKTDGAVRGHSANYSREEEGSDDEGAISLNAIKNKYKSGSGVAVKGSAIYSSDEDDSDIENSRTKKHNNKVLKDSEEESASE